MERLVRERKQIDSDSAALAYSKLLQYLIEFPVLLGIALHSLIVFW